MTGSAGATTGGRGSGGYTVGSLFTGIGGIDYAFAAAGFDIRFQVEIDPFCRSVLAKHNPTHWPNAVVHEDVKHVGRFNLEAVDVLCGGFPCQDVSLSGKRAGIHVGTRSGLWFEFARIIGELRPRVVLLENVDDIVSLGGTTVIGSLAEMGYDALWLPLRAADIGAPHTRERWFCVAVGTVPHADGQRYVQPPTYESLRDRDGHDPAAQPQRHEQLHASERGSEAVGNPHSFAHAPQRARGTSVASVGLGGRQPQGTNRQRERNVHQSRMGMSADGLSRRLAGHRFPALMGLPQYSFEPPRTLSKASDTTNWHEKVHALGNAVVPQVIYPLAVAVRTWLTAQDAAAESEGVA